MLVTVKVLKGKELKLEVTSTISVLQFKERINKELKVSEDQQKLVFKGKTLSDGHCLSDYNVVDGTKLHLIVNTPVEKSYIFWKELELLLQKHFSPTESAKILDNFKKEYNSTLSTLSLDDLERIATLNLGNKPYHAANKDSSTVLS